MSNLRYVLVSTVCLSLCSQASALLSINVLQDDTTVPGWVINTFTADSDYDLLSALALSDLITGSMLNLPSVFPETFSSGPGDSFVTINGDPNTNRGLAPGDLTFPGPSPGAFFDSTGIGDVWYNIRPDDIGTDLLLATLTFSSDALGGLEMWVSSNEGTLRNTFSIVNGAVSLVDFTFDSIPIEEDPPESPNTDPTPEPTDPPTGGETFPDDGSAIPEPAGLGLLAAAAALIGGLHRRRL